MWADLGSFQSQGGGHVFLFQAVGEDAGKGWIKGGENVRITLPEGPAARQKCMIWLVTSRCCSRAALFRLRPCILPSLSLASDSSSAISQREECEVITEPAVWFNAIGLVFSTIFLIGSNTEENTQVLSFTCLNKLSFRDVYQKLESAISDHHQSRMKYISNEGTILYLVFIWMHLGLYVWFNSFMQDASQFLLFITTKCFHNQQLTMT